MASPSKFAHVVYNTHRYDEMIEWYLNVFEARIAQRGDRLAFLTYDDEHHRFAFFNLGEVPDGDTPSKEEGVGVHHVAYTFANLDDLMSQYERLRESGITPERPIRHGMTLSMYYLDPDGNRMEFQIDLMDADAANDFMETDAFAANPIGELFDPEELLSAWKQGEPMDALVFRSDQPDAALPA